MIPLTLLFFAQKRNLLIPLELSRVMHQGRVLAQYAIEFWIEGGFTPMDAIRAGTAVGAQNIGLGDDLGTLEPGKLADISLEANPLEKRWAWHKIHLVMKAGERYDTLSWR